LSLQKKIYAYRKIPASTMVALSSVRAHRKGGCAYREVCACRKFWAQSKVSPFRSQKKSNQVALTLARFVGDEGGDDMVSAFVGESPFCRGSGFGPRFFGDLIGMLTWSRCYGFRTFLLNNLTKTLAFF
jgi:hypothetical protein